MRLCLHVSIPRVCLVLREARRGCEIPGVGDAKGCELPRGSSAKAAMLSTVGHLSCSCLGFACLFSKTGSHVPQADHEILILCLHLPRVHGRWAPQPGILRVIVNDSSSASTVFSRCFASGLGSAVLSALVPLLSLFLFSTTEITGWLQVPWLGLQCDWDKIRRTLGQLGNHLLLWME